MSLSSFLFFFDVTHGKYMTYIKWVQHKNPPSLTSHFYSMFTGTVYTFRDYFYLFYLFTCFQELPLQTFHLILKHPLDLLDVVFLYFQRRHQKH